MYLLALTIHVLAAVIWVGGIFFAFALMRPVLGTMEKEQSLTLWKQVLKKFFPWVWLCIVVLLASGFYMIFALGWLTADFNNGPRFGKQSYNGIGIFYDTRAPGSVATPSRSVSCKTMILSLGRSPGKTCG